MNMILQRIRSAASNTITRANEPSVRNVPMEYHILLKATLDRLSDSRITYLSNDKLSYYTVSS